MLRSRPKSTPKPQTEMNNAENKTPFIHPE